MSEQPTATLLLSRASPCAVLEGHSGSVWFFPYRHLARQFAERRGIRITETQR